MEPKFFYGMQTSMTRSYLELYAPFIWGSFIIAVFGGFLLAAYLSLSMGSGWWSGAFLFEIIQLHGHLQLVGWMGMLLVGVSLYILPRLMSASVPLAKADSWIFTFLSTGIFVRILAVFSGLIIPIDMFTGEALLIFASLFEFGGIALYVFICFMLIFRAKNGNNDLKRLWPYFVCMLSGWSIFAIGQLCLSFWPGGQTSVLLSQEWNGVLNDLFVRLVLIPAIFCFGAKMLPVFLGLTPPRWPVRNVGLALLVSTCLYVVSKGVLIVVPEASVVAVMSAVGLLGISISVLAYIWFLDGLLFRILPERIALKVYRSDVKEQRGRFGDKGEYGRFELFVVVGFAWLLIVAVLEGINALRALAGVPELISHTILRHALLLGGLAHLVLGVSHRLLPGLLDRKLLSPRLTEVSFFLLFSASLLRVIPLVITDLGSFVPLGYFAWSGVVGLFAVSVAFLNLFGRRGPTSKQNNN